MPKEVVFMWLERLLSQFQLLSKLSPRATQTVRFPTAIPFVTMQNSVTVEKKENKRKNSKLYAHISTMMCHPEIQRSACFPCLTLSYTEAQPTSMPVFS